MSHDKTPDGYINTDGWSNPSNAIDSSPGTYAYRIMGKREWATFIATNTIPIYCSGIKWSDILYFNYGEVDGYASAPTIVKYHKTDDNGQEEGWVTISSSDSSTAHYFSSPLSIDQISISVNNNTDIGSGIYQARIRYIWFYAVDKPTLATPSISALTGNTVTLNGNITTVDSSTVIERGFQYKLGSSGNVITEDDVGSYSTGAFSANITGLTSEGTYYFRAYATTLAGTGYSDWVSFTTYKVPVVTTTATPITLGFQSATLGGEVTDNGDRSVTRRGIEYKLYGGSTPLNVYEDNADWGENTFSLDIENLSTVTKYAFRAYAVTTAGTGYGDWEDFTTNGWVPIVQTSNCTDIGTTSVTANGNIIDKGGEDILTRGFCYKEGTTGDPTTADDTVSEGAGSGDYDLGIYNLSITGLTPSKSYLVRAYAVNSIGTGYGETIQITGYTFTPNAETFFENFYNKCYIANGKDKLMRYDGDTVATAGIEAPTTAPTGVGGGTDGSLGVGNYYFKYTYVDADGYESNPSPASSAIVVGSTQHVTVTVANSSNPKVVAKNIYRTFVNGAIYYYDGQITDNTTTTYSSTKADLSLQNLVNEDHDAPITAIEMVTKKGNRLFLSQEDNIYISKLSDVEYYPAAWFIKTGLRQNIFGLIEHYDTLGVLTQNSIERLLGTDEDNYVLKNTWSKKGCYAKRSVQICEGLLVYLTYDGLYYYDGNSVAVFNRRLNKYIQDNINHDYIHKAASIYHNGLYLLSYPKGDSTVNSETIYIDIINRTTGVYDFAFSCYSKWDRQADGDRIFGGSTTEGIVYELNNNATTDNSTGIASWDETDFMDFGYPEVWKQFYHLYIKVKNTTADTLTFYYTLDNNTEQSIETYLNQNSTQWYKLDLLGGGQRGRAIKLRPYVNSTDKVTFCGYMVVFEFEEVEYS